jgi:tetratricopeptide (TPR) repeat protein
VPLFEETLKLRKARLGPEHPDTLKTMGNLAGAYRATEKLDLAVPLFEETLKLQKARLGPEHPDTLNTMGNLAGAYDAGGKLDLAVPLFEKTLKLMKARLGPEHPETLIVMGDLAVAYWQTRQTDRSISLFEEVLKLYEKKLGRDDPETLRIAANLGVNYKETGRIAAALLLLEQTYRAAKAHPRLQWVGQALLDCYVRAGKFAQGIALAQEMAPEIRRTFPKDSPQLAGGLAQLGLSMLQAKAFTQAEPLLRDCQAIREETQPNAWTTFNTQSMLGGALLGQQKYAAAEPLLLKGYEGMKQREKTIPPEGIIRIPEAVDRLTALYTATNKPDEAKKWKAERAKYPQTKPAEKQ